MKVLSSRSSNPTSDDLCLARSFTLSGALHRTGNRRLQLAWFESEIGDFSSLANRFHLLFWNCKSTEKTSYKR